MKQKIIIKVARMSNNSQKPYIDVFEKIIDSDSSINVPYHSIVDCFRYVFGNNVIITISNCLY